jgi:hypothetical protein
MPAPSRSALTWWIRVDRSAREEPDEKDRDGKEGSHRVSLNVLKLPELPGQGMSDYGKIMAAGNMGFQGSAVREF